MEDSTSEALLEELNEILANIDEEDLNFILAGLTAKDTVKRATPDEMNDLLNELDKELDELQKAPDYTSGTPWKAAVPPPTQPRKIKIRLS